MNKNIIFIINIIKDERSKNQGYDYSLKSWKHYSKKIGADIFVLDEPLFDFSYMKHQWDKMYILYILDENEVEYNQVLYVDADTIIHPNAPNIFEITENKFLFSP